MDGARGATLGTVRMDPMDPGAGLDGGAYAARPLVSAVGVPGTTPALEVGSFDVSSSVAAETIRAPRAALPHGPAGTSARRAARRAAPGPEAPGLPCRGGRGGEDARVAGATSRPWRRPLRWDLLVLGGYVAIVVVCVLTKGALFHGREQNVFRILRTSFLHLSEGRDLYAPDPARHHDIFLYSPTFAFLFAPFALLPFWLGLLLWDALNVGLLWVGVGRLLAGREALAVRALVLLEVLRTTQHSQSNALLTGLILLAFVSLEQARQAAGALAVALGAFVKVFPLGAAAFALFHPRRARFAALLAVCLVVLAALPLLLVSADSWSQQHAAWGERVAQGAHAQEGVRELPTGPGLYGGVAEQLRLWFGRGIPNLVVTAMGLLGLLAPLLRGPSLWREAAFRRGFLASFLVFAVIFNHESESPSFVIAVTGIAIWHVTGPRGPWRTALMALTLLVVSASSLEGVPESVQTEIFYRWRLKTLPCVLAWIWMQVDLWRARRSAPRPEEPSPATA